MFVAAMKTIIQDQTLRMALETSSATQIKTKENHSAVKFTVSDMLRYNNEKYNTKCLNEVSHI